MGCLPFVLRSVAQSRVCSRCAMLSLISSVLSLPSLASVRRCRMDRTTIELKQSPAGAGANPNTCDCAFVGVIGLPSFRQAACSLCCDRGDPGPLLLTPFLCDPERAAVLGALGAGLGLSPPSAGSGGSRLSLDLSPLSLSAGGAAGSASASASTSPVSGTPEQQQLQRQRLLIQQQQQQQQGSPAR